MARLPQPGGDNGNWGSILNDFLGQSLKPDGTVKDAVVTSDVLAPNSVTSAAIDSASITTSAIAPDSVTKPKLSQTLRDEIDGKISQVIGDQRYIKLGDTAKSVKDYGAVGDGSTDDTVAIRNAINAQVPLYWPRGAYVITETLNVSLNGARWHGDAAVLFTSNVEIIISATSALYVSINDISFVNYSQSATESYNGLLTFDRVPFRSVQFTNSFFSAPLRPINGIKIIADDSSENLVRDSQFIRCTFINIGRMGLEIQDHSVDTSITRISNILVKDSTFESNGKLATGIDLSFSGGMANVRTEDNSFIDTTSMCVEYVGAHRTPVVSGNTFSKVGDASKLWVFSNPNGSTYVTNATFKDNVSLDYCGSGTISRNLQNWTSANNNLRSKNGMFDFGSCGGGLSVNDRFDSHGVYALYVEGKSTGNVWHRATLSTDPGGYSVIRFLGSDVHGNKVTDSSVDLQDGGVIDELNGAWGNSVERTRINTSEYQSVKQFTVSNTPLNLSGPDTDAELIVLNGTPSAPQTVILPRSIRQWSIKNNTAQTLTVSIGIGSTNVVAPSQTKRILSDGSSIYDI